MRKPLLTFYAALGLIWGCAPAPAGSEDPAAPEVLSRSDDPLVMALCPAGAAAWGGEPPGALRLQCRLPDGRLHGLERAWDAQGRLREEGHHQEGQRHGAWAAWHVNGRRSSQGSYLRGQKEGLWTSWGKGGAVRERAWFRQGRLVAMENPER